MSLFRGITENTKPELIQDNILSSKKRMQRELDILLDESPKGKYMNFVKNMKKNKKITNIFSKSTQVNSSLGSSFKEPASRRDSFRSERKESPRTVSIFGDSLKKDKKRKVKWSEKVSLNVSGEMSKEGDTNSTSVVFLTSPKLSPKSKFHSSNELKQVFQRSTKKGQTSGPQMPLIKSFEKRKMKITRYSTSRFMSLKNLPRLSLEEKFADFDEKLNTKIENLQTSASILNTQLKEEEKYYKLARAEYKKARIKEREFFEELIGYKKSPIHVDDKFFNCMIQEKNNNVLSKVNENVLMKNTQFFVDNFGNFDDNLKKRKKSKVYKLKV